MSKVGSLIVEYKDKMYHITWFILAMVGLAIRIYIIERASVGDNYYEGEFSMFTDLDYKVYLDASLYDSPYGRHTYRYSPLLAYLVSPSYLHNQLFGKYLIACFDLLSCYYLYKIFANRTRNQVEYK